MSDDRTKLLAACVDYRAMLDKLEAENASLREDIKKEKIHRSLDGWNEAAIIKDLKRENAALREDKARLDWLDDKGCWLTIPGQKNFVSGSARAVIDSEMGVKE